VRPKDIIGILFLVVSLVGGAAIVWAIVRVNRRNARRLLAMRQAIAGELGLKLEYDDAIVGERDGIRVRIIWSERSYSRGRRRVTICEIPLNPGLGMGLVLTIESLVDLQGFVPKFGAKRRADVPGRVYLRSRDHANEEIVASAIRAAGCELPPSTWIEADDRSVRLFGWEHTSDSATLVDRLARAASCARVLTMARLPS